MMESFKEQFQEELNLLNIKLEDNQLKQFYDYFKL